MQAMEHVLESPSIKRAPFASPFLRAGRLQIAQTANILFYLGPRPGLAPRGEAGQRSETARRGLIRDRP